jgi:acyl-[acyl-carrier-protein]-phospholipid O-acyltransferase/long-chain-fatty-acid--[acyl-carrier-protein] ligase
MILGMNVSSAELHRVGELVTALFSLPFILFSMAGGFLADRFSKRTICISVKVFEIGVMLLAVAGFALHQLPLLLGGVFLMGVHSSFFGPSKYGLLPELLPEKRLSWGNGLIELGTFLAIILGTVAAANLSKHFARQPVWSGVILLVLALLGLMTSLGITRVPAADPARKFRANFLGDLFAQLRLIRRDRALTLAVLGNTYFFFLGQLLQLNVFFYGAQTLRLDTIGIGNLSIVLALGIGSGSVAAGYLSCGKIEYGFVPLGAFAMSLVCAWLSVPDLSVNAVLFRLALLGFTGGFFIVPLCALLQHRPDPAKKGEVLAAANLLSFIGIFLASGAYYLLADVAGLSPHQIFFFGGVLTLVGAILVPVLSPESLVRAFLWLVTRPFYRLRVCGLENVPRRGGALLVSNHVSFVDWLLLTVAADRPVRFLIGKEYYESPWLKPFVRVARVIPIPAAARPHEVSRALGRCRDAIRNGDVVCVFAEGGITRTGWLMPFQRGFEKIMRGVDAPIVPVALGGVWGSVFSFAGGKFFWKWPKRLRRPVTVNFGWPLPPTTAADEVRRVVEKLLSGKIQDRTQMKMD